MEPIGADLDDAVQATIDHVAIDRLQRAYADAVTCRDWEAVRALFLPGAVVSLDLVTRPPRDVEAPDALVGFIAGALERYRFFEFVILNSHIELWPDGDRTAASARVFMCELRHAEGEEERDDAYGLYQDSYRKLDGRWLITGRRYRSLARYPSGEVFGLPERL